ncbi:hypothetical protein BCR44DRAFT_1425521 [Catenaria anguillulae PL171]|uniref:Uncharacterized protein n=1 Tax=Catenaria anguillulae PL171 TaxID=765915 RepID=A0A1Y2I198_9FUNG|nr:hypothetical protein BCR44DRAFT_1425521 [Catenaria anguillulae PL171]
MSHAARPAATQPPIDHGPSFSSDFGCSPGRRRVFPSDLWQGWFARKSFHHTLTIDQ